MRGGQNNRPAAFVAAATLLIVLGGLGRGSALAMLHKIFPVAHAAMIPRMATPNSDSVVAVSALSFLNSLGINLHLDQGYDPALYLEHLRYTGIREVRDGTSRLAREIMIHQRTGVRFAINGGARLDDILVAGRTLAAAGALLALEGPNEPNNFPVTYKAKRSGASTWMPVAEFQSDLYKAVRSDPVLNRYPVFGASETGAEPDNVGLQFLVIPSGSKTLLPANTRYADYANVHNYVIGNGNIYGNNQAWNAADPRLDGRWDSLYGNVGTTWSRHFAGYAVADLPRVPRVTTETGWDSVANPGGQKTQGTILTNTYLAQFKRGWRYTFVYEMTDGEGGAGHQGLYDGTSPKLSGVYVHNLTTILSDNADVRIPARLRYVIPEQPATVHDLLLQKSSGELALVIWDERRSGQDQITVKLRDIHKPVRIFDITKGVLAVQTINHAASIPLTLTDHAMILEIDR